MLTQTTKVTDVTSSEMKCYENSTAAQTAIATVVAGSTVGFKADNTMGHPGVRAAALLVIIQPDCALTI